MATPDVIAAPPDQARLLDLYRRFEEQLEEVYAARGEMVDVGGTAAVIRTDA